MPYKDPEYAKKWKAANPEKVEAYRIKELPKARARSRKWYYAHIDENRENKNEYHKQWRLKNPEKRKAIKRKSDLKINYGITIEQYEQLLFEQKECCAICNKKQVNDTRRLDIDHNHITGKVRGLLCSKCNTALGLLNEDLELFNKAANYLSRRN